MPPPRRRRPVQPATRVRLPRAARSRTDADAPPAGSAGREPPPGEAQDGATPGGTASEQATETAAYLAPPAQASEARGPQDQVPGNEQDTAAIDESPAPGDMPAAADRAEPAGEITEP